jgi:hypothetical protein
VLARGKRSFQPRDRGRLRSHALGDLRLCETGLLPGSKQQVEEGTLVAFDSLDFLADAGAPQQLGNDLIMSSHA